MRPLLIPSSYAPHVGGVEEVVAHLAAEFSARGMAPAVATNHWPRSLPPDESIDGIQVTRHAFRVPHRSVRGMAGWALGRRAAGRALTATARAARADLLNIHCVSSNAEYTLATARALSLPVVASLHGELGNDASDVYRHDARLVRAWRTLIDRADAITAPSQFVLDQAEQFYGVPFGPRASVIRNGVDQALFGGPRRPARRPFVFAVGRLVRPKGFDVLIDAFSRLPAGVDLVIGGDGPERADLEQRATTSGGRIRLLGNLGRAQVADHLARAAAFVLPSHAEPLGLTVLEAMTARTPVIATRAGGVPELIEHAVSGLLVRPGDPDGMAGAIADLLAEPDAADLRARAAAEFARTLTWSACADAYLDAYRTAGVAP